MIMLSRKCDRLFLKIQDRFLAFYRVQLMRISSDGVTFTCDVDRSLGATASGGPIRLTHSVSFSDTAPNAVSCLCSEDFGSSHGSARDHADSCEDLRPASPALGEHPEAGLHCDNVQLQEQRSCESGPAISGAAPVNGTAAPPPHPTSVLGILAHSDFICAWQVYMPLIKYISV
jgi:hypothetical protein